MTRQLVRSLERLGHQASVLTNEWPEGLPRAELLDGVEVRRVAFPLPRADPAGGFQFARSAPQAARVFTRAVRQGAPDVVHVMGAGPQAVYAGTLKRFIGAPIVFTAHGELAFDAHQSFRHSATLRHGLRLMLKRATAVTACSRSVLDDLHAFSRINGSTEVIPNGVDIGEFDDADPEKGFGRYVLALGRLVPQKGFDVLVQAFANETLSGLNLVIAGEGFERAKLEAQAHDLGAAARVHLLGTVDRPQVARLMAGARIFAFPSRGEAFGIALLEAMAAGVPSVAAAAGGVPELAVDGENALLVEAGNTGQLAAAIARLDHDPVLRERLVTGGKRTAQRLSWERVSARYASVYDRVAAEGAR